MTTTDGLPLTDTELAALIARLPHTRTDDLAWRDRAACNDITIDGRPLTEKQRVEAFFPDVTRVPEHRRYLLARDVCADCPVWLECLAYWLTTTSTTQDRVAAAGFVGRCTPHERNQIRHLADLAGKDHAA